MTFLKKQDCYVIKTSDRFTAGIPDILICMEGRFIALELKVGKNKPTKIQDYHLRKIRKAGGYSQVIYTFEEFKDEFDEGFTSFSKTAQQQTETL